MGVIVLLVLMVASGAGADARRLVSQSPPPGAHWCRAGDPPLHASRQTSCGLAAGVVNVLFNGPALKAGPGRTISVRSPNTHKLVRIRLVRLGDHVTATGPNGIWVRFYYET